MKSPGCESCILRCDIDAIQTNLRTKIDEADKRRHEADLGVEITFGMAEEIGIEIELENISEASGIRDDSITVMAKATERADLYSASVAALQAQKAVMTDPVDLRLRSTGAIDITLAKTMADLMDESCEGRPLRGFAIPLTGIVVPLPGGRGEQFCASAAAGGAMRFVERVAVEYPGVIPAIPETPAQ